jgi:group I intron endonuclease
MDYKHLKNQSGIYIITNIINNKVYIGQSRMADKNLNRCGLRGRGRNTYIALNNNRYHNNQLQKDYIEYTTTSFVLEALLYCQEEQLNYWEEYYISIFKATNPQFGYNILSVPGWSEHHKDEIRSWVGHKNKGKKHSEEAKIKMSIHAKANPSKNLCKKGDKLPYWWKEKISKGNKGKPKSEEHKKALSRPCLEETKQKLSALNKGKKLSPEAIEKSRLAHIGLKYKKKPKP